MNIQHTKPKEMKPILAVKGLMLSPIILQNDDGVIEAVSVDPALPMGLELSVENKVGVLRGRPMQVSPRAYYTITFKSAATSRDQVVALSVVEAPIKEQRAAIMIVHDTRHDLDTPRSQIANAMNDAAMMGSTIKPHEKFANQPMGDDKRLSQQTANNPEAENRAENAPELTPSPSAKLQQQAIARATPNITPKPGG
ncbi:MAG: hypothetical protein COY58_02585 [Gammaproteobacteria bacterium CG_4_10_14_0_8_um_filter_38_16]|nr:MAG: hypothetical protein COY58_02585 [Gammaproteobacteria bacterium CG_4_10_14_0_8_um_filter_38_16]PJA03820.1 MAG: hypothetical protein COX72_02745 [Gammaproteobacteria bacterium CG_4_10_14_0_2_um_filter_38_22]PJB10794.1 MAG: hypothetical protein CO120_02850 [Gammaproteobacteria bacterium CG_4_9_14_3_um_filter_38_9]